MDLCFIDTETTGLHPDQHDIWEFAGIRRNHETGEETRLWLMIETDLGKADTFALNIGKYRERFGKAGFWNPDVKTDGEGNVILPLPTPQKGEVITGQMEAAALIADFTRGTILWGGNVSFDAERVGRLLRDNWQVPEWHYHPQDISGHIQGYLRALQKYEHADVDDVLTHPVKSDELSAAIGVSEPSEELRHTAMGDAEWVMRQHDAIYL